MRGQAISRFVFLAATTVAASSIGHAQSATPAARPDDPARPQVQTFEMVLGRALETAGRNFATRSAEMAPELTAFPTGENPQVTGVAVRDLGLYVFHVQVPGIDLQLSWMNLMLNRQQFAVRPDGLSQQQQVSGRVQSTGVVTPDPMASSAAPVAPQARTRSTLLDLRVVYQTQVREALVDAIVDNAASLPMGADDALLVIAGGIDPPVTNPLYRKTSHRLVLRAKGADLQAFRESRITRDEVKKRIVASDF